MEVSTATIMASDLDPTFKYEIASHPGGEHFNRCFTCGTCTAICPVAEVHPEYDPRAIIRMAVLGMRQQVLSSDLIWMCAQCYTCSSRCPQDVKFADVMGILREMAVKEGYVPPERQAQVEEMDRYIQDLRCKLIAYLLDPQEEKRQAIRSMVEAKL
jgi:heterodisulfide reductase subunit C